MTPDEQRVQDVRRALADPMRLVQALGLHERAQRQARGLTIRCPWHRPDRNPSCSVIRADDGTIAVHCFSCGESGDALTLIAKVHGLDVRRDFRGVLAVAATIAGMHATAAELEQPWTPPTIDDARFHAIATELVERCPFDREDDVLGYLDRRVLIVMGTQARLFALPAPDKQAPLVAELVELFGGEDLARAGLLRRTDEGAVRLDRFAYPANRLGIPWRDRAGHIQTIQRRLIADRPGASKKYVFPAARRPAFPFGVEQLAGAAATTRIAFVEGALDALAVRLLARRDGLDLVALGLPGAQSWRAEWAELARGHEAILALDADRAGEEPLEKIARDLRAAGATAIDRWVPKGARDWAELVERGAA